MATVCASCAQPLTVSITPDDDPQAPPETVPDDVQLQACGCHFHWQCLLDAYSVTNCPHCNTQLSPASTSQQDPTILVNLHNEGGVQTDVDIYDTLREESYLKAYPEETRARAFLEFCREGDVEAIVELLRNEEEDSDDDDDTEDTSMGDGDQEPDVDILRYQDSLNGNVSGLHCAVQGGSQDVAWLLLYMASQLPLEEFPEVLRGQAQGVGLVRESLRDEVDIRGLKDAEGRTAEDLARQEGGVWQSWLGTGRLSA